MLTILNFLVFISFRRHVKFVNSSTHQGGPNVYSGREHVIKIKVSLTIVTVFLVCHLPRIFTDVQEIVCNIQLSLDEAKRLKVNICGNIITNCLLKLIFLIFFLVFDGALV